jgi:peptide/nickel transport system permease protein
MRKRLKNMNTRERMLFAIVLSGALLLLIFILSFTISDDALRVNVKSQNLPPSLKHLFGTDWLGRDMFARTMKGLRLSLSVGTAATLLSVCVAVTMGVCAAVFGKAVDSVISWVIDLFIGVPHLIFGMLVCFMMGGGAKGLIFGIGLTHWSALARLVRAEVLQIKTAEYIQVSAGFGKSVWFIAHRHVLPYIFPQVMIGFLIYFPHAILHEAAITFLGFGFSAQTPAVGVILSEAMSHISTGKWWLALFPGLLLVMVAKSFDNIGEQVRILLEPASGNE